MNKTWIHAAAVRAIKTVAQTAVSMIGVGAAVGEVEWVRVGSCALVAGILSLLTSLAGLPEVQPEPAATHIIDEVDE